MSEELTTTTEDSQEITPSNNGSKSELYQEKPGGKFKKGNPGGGKPKGTLSLVTLIKQRLEQVGPDGQRTIAEHFVDNLLQDALGLDTQSRKLLMQYIEGMPLQKTDVEIGFKPTPLLNAIRNNNSSPSDSPTEEEN